MLLQWNKYAQRLGDKGQKIMESLLLINDPVLDGTKIILELPTEGSKLDFEKEINGLLGHLRGHLHNHDITIEVIVNEAIETKRNLNDQDRYNRLLEINPNIELLRSTFGLDLPS
jgi:DNA polymerase-3 subunit gamma/tau